MKLKGTVHNGTVAVDLPDGTPVTVVVDNVASANRLPHELAYELDADGQLVVTPELEASLAEAQAEAERGELVPWDDVRAEMRRRR